MTDSLSVGPLALSPSWDPKQTEWSSTDRPAEASASIHEAGELFEATATLRPAVAAKAYGATPHDAAAALEAVISASKSPEVTRFREVTGWDSFIQLRDERGKNTTMINEPTPQPDRQQPPAAPPPPPPPKDLPPSSDLPPFLGGES